jgi:hypothetical protein
LDIYDYRTEEYNEAMARRRYTRRRDRHIRERDQRRLAKEVASFQFDDDNTLFDMWTSELLQDQDQDQAQDQDEIQVQILAEIQGQDVDLDQDIGPQKRQYQGQDLDQDTGRRYPLRKCQLTVKVAVLII